RFELEAWDHCSEQMAAVAASKLSSAAKTPLSNELYIQTLVGSVMSGGKAALRVWFTQTGAAITEESLATLRELLSDAMAILQHGFTH
ncbi:MAG: TetR/AcrR family transcriptional regulator, partial [Acidobacteria bacterium]|nr:TetR/AcrR family transcriptional regulator [Acidobacteriota bacterium]